MSLCGTTDALVFLPDHVAWLMHRPEAEQVVSELHAALNHLRSVIDSHPDRVYAGPCDYCRQDLYAEQGAAQVTCVPCAATWEMDARREWLLEQVASQLATASQVAHALTSLGQPLTPGRVRQWASRGMLTAHGLDGTRPTYRVGDVQRLLV